jgi:hypothetical protein
MRGGAFFIRGLFFSAKICGAFYEKICLKDKNLFEIFKRYSKSPSKQRLH